MQMLDSSVSTLNALTMKEALYSPPVFAQRNYEHHNFVKNVPNYTHFASPMVHPKTGETISSYKRLMHDPAAAEVWQTIIPSNNNAREQWK